MAKNKKSGCLTRLKRLFGFVLVLSIAIGGVMQVSPSISHKVMYYFYEGQDWCLAQLGLLPHYDNLDLGAPAGKTVDRIFNREGYAFGYSETYEQPLWVTYKLTADELDNKRVGRTDDFREDPRILTRSALPEDYTGSDYDRGHLAPAADMGWSKKVMSESFYMSNMSPQNPTFNRGIWGDLESRMRDIARKEKEVFIVTGPIFYPGKDVQTIGRKNRVSVPHAYYKVVYDLTVPRKMIAYILPNEKGKKDLDKYMVTVSAVEDATGLTFFPNLSPDEAALKKKFAPFSW